MRIQLPMRTLNFAGFIAAVLLLALALTLAGTAQGQHAHMHDDAAIHPDQEIGSVDFGAECSGSAQQDFDRALGLMHHMMYEQARAGFQSVAESDPECAMAYWGEATTLFQPLWGTRPSKDDLQRGWQAISKARELADAPREQALIEATAGFFQDPETAEFRARINRWTEGMKQAHEAHPDDPDITALYALSLLTIAQTAENRDPLHDEAEKLLRSVFEEVPDHPGAIHYSIHATDADGRARNALDMVEVYGKIAPDVPHALHMPSHIYVRLGDWPEVIDWNVRSAEAALRQPAGDAVSHHYIHALDYLLYAHLQRGEDEKARQVYEQAMQTEGHQRSFVAAFHVAAMPARHAVERRQWEEAVAIEPRTPDYLPWDASRWAEGMSWFARGLGGVHTDALDIAREAEKKLESLRDQAKADGDQHFATYIETDRRILSGWIAHAEGDNDQALEHLRTAAKLEGSIEKHPVTPGALYPPSEALGDLLSAMDRPDEALEAYRASNRTWPGRYNTLLGAARAAASAGDERLARRYYEQLLAVSGETRRPDIDEARQVIGARVGSR
jgi:tetratricopeptide (TPR) repeat protein